MVVMYCTNVNCLPSSLSSANTQPVAIFQDEEESDEEADNEPDWKKRKIWAATTPLCVHVHASVSMSVFLCDCVLVCWGVFLYVYSF